MSVVLEVRDLKRSVGEQVIITHLSFTVHEADVLFIRGPSGVGKTLLLRALAYLDPFQVLKKFEAHTTCLCKGSTCHLLRLALILLSAAYVCCIPGSAGKTRGASTLLPTQAQYRSLFWI